MGNKIRTNAAALRNELAPLYRHYPRQSNPQPAYLELIPEERRLVADYSSEIGNAVPSAVFHNRVYRLAIPATLRGSVVARLLEDPGVLSLVEVIFEGYSLEWTGSNHRGDLTEYGVEALDTLERGLSAYRFSEGDHVEVWGVDDWLSTWEPSPGETFEEAAETIQRNAKYSGVLLIGDVLGWLRKNY